MDSDAVLGCECDVDYCCPQCEAMEAAEFKRLKDLYEAEKRAGLLRPQTELDQELRDAGRGHLVKP